MSGPEPSIQELSELGQQLRVDVVRCTHQAQSGHATSGLSAADLMAVLLARHLRYDFTDPYEPNNDRLIFSKGHASPLLYAMFAAAGTIDDEELLSYRTLGSRLEGHPTPRLPWVDVATGSLGQGLPIGVGFALAGRYLDHLPYRVWVLCGDSELAEGSMWEAFEHAGQNRLDNLTAVIDINALGQRGPTRYGWDTTVHATRLRALGWHTVDIDGHDPAQIDAAYTEAAESAEPTAILARTVKGKGVSAVEGVEDAHGKPVPDLDEAVAELGGRRSITVDVPARAPAGGHTMPGEPVKLPSYEPGQEVATRTAYGEALVALGDALPDVVALDGEVSDSTRAGYFARAHPDRFFQCYIAEQQMVAAAVGMQARGWTPYVATFAAFLGRAYDFIRMAAIGRADLQLVGSHAGVSIGKDGPSQMGLEDMAAFRPVYGSTVLYPCDANQTAHLTSTMAAHPGICYLRTTRGATPVIYDAERSFPVGGSCVHRAGEDDQVAIVAAGITVHEALEAADFLAEHGMAARVIDAYSVKPLDGETVRDAAARTGRVITVEDHWPTGGLGDAVLDALTDAHDAPRVTKLGVTSMPASAEPDEQLHHAGIDSSAIIDAAWAQLNQS
ncbi:transketolase [Haloechinothrix alba]|uniref:Transketolase n=1 Tax=Haloechinothrix alba TaxID=664784 RepID=A0A238XB77_9PSEU|nr:transketolase [Haloechinothrix alba]SNR55793.1 transketolase [Haloechinothrix alba]